MYKYKYKKIVTKNIKETPKKKKKKKKNSVIKSYIKSLSPSLFLRHFRVFVPSKLSCLLSISLEFNPKISQTHIAISPIHHTIYTIHSFSSSLNFQIPPIHKSFTADFNNSQQKKKAKILDFLGF